MDSYRKLRGVLSCLPIFFLLAACGQSTPTRDNQNPATGETVIAAEVEPKPELCDEKTKLLRYCSQRMISVNQYEIRDNLYWVTGVGLAFKSKGVGMFYDATLDSKMQSDQIMMNQTVFQPITGDGKIEKVIDVKSWRGGGIFYRDDFNFYCHHGRSDGGRLGHYSEFDPNNLAYLLNDGRLIPWKDAEGFKFRKIEGFHGDYLTNGEKVIDFRCSIKSMEEHEARVAKQNAYIKKRKKN